MVKSERLMQDFICFNESDSGCAKPTLDVIRNNFIIHEEHEGHEIVSVFFVIFVPFVDRFHIPDNVY